MEELSKQAADFVLQLKKKINRTSLINSENQQSFGHLEIVVLQVIL